MRRLLLIPIALLGLATAGALASTHRANDASVGRITLLDSTSITVGKRHPLACAIGANSPGTGLFAIGELGRVDCTNGVLAEIAGRTRAHKTSVTGTIGSRRRNSITINGRHDVTCKLD